MTGEPSGRPGPGEAASRFVVQKHAATRLHYDLRLEIDGVLVSWAVPKGPSFDPTIRRMAIHVEDHPLEYGDFEGTIPRGQYGAGTVIVWDRGTFTPVGDPRQGLADGKLLFRLDGHKLVGAWELVRIAKPGERQEGWILFKKRDEHARPESEFDVVRALPDSVIAKPLKPPAQDVIANTPKTPKTPKTPGPGPAGGASSVPGALAGPLPETLGPQLATFATGVPASGTWRYEIKFDGYRMMTRIDDGKPTLFTRGGHDWTARLPVLVRELKRLAVRTAWLDGEIVVLDDAGRPDFNALQNAFDHRRVGDIVYFLFDLPFLDGHDLRQARLDDRRRLLETLLAGHPTEHLRLSTAFDADLGSMLASARRMGLEGVIAKRADSPYRSRRTETWLKLKCRQRQEFIVCGFTERSDDPAQIGSLILCVYGDDRSLVTVGSVGTGWRGEEAGNLRRRLQPLVVDTPAFGTKAARGRWSRRKPGEERWVRPTMAVEVEFGDWTPDGQIRHATWIAVREEDKPVTSIRREIPKPLGPDPKPAPAGRIGGIQVTHGERVIDPSTRLTKLDLVRYYESVADRILPHLRGRPCSLVRAPDGITGQIFFQKHGERIGIPGIRDLDPSLFPGHASLIEVATEQALIGCAQMNVIEFHTWNSKVTSIDRPDRIVFDLDPGEGSKWEHMREAAKFVRVLLDELGLKCWLKTSGGKGLHVVVPIAPRLEHPAVKDFAEAVVQHLAKVLPSRFVARSGQANRVGRIFVDYLRNSHGATTAAAFSARARPGLGVSMPIAWDDLPALKSGAQWTIATARDWLSFQSADPWADFARNRQGLATAIRRLGATGKDRARGKT